MRSLWLRRSLETRPRFRGEQDAPYRTIDANKAGPGPSAVTLEELETFSSRKDHRGKVEEAGGCRATKAADGSQRSGALWSGDGWETTQGEDTRREQTGVL